MAIAFDTASGDFVSANTTLSWTHTTSGADRFLFVAIYASEALTGVTYNGVAMTLINSVTFSSNTLYLYGLANPAAGANTVQITTGANDTIYGWSASYTGADQGAVDTTSDVLADQDGNDAFSISLAVPGSGGWTVLPYWNPNAAAGSAGSGSNLQFTHPDYGGFRWFDSGAPVSGTHTMELDTASGGVMVGVIGRLAVAGEGGGPAARPFVTHLTAKRI